MKNLLIIILTFLMSLQLKSQNYSQIDDSLLFDGGITTITKYKNDLFLGGTFNYVSKKTNLFPAYNIITNSLDSAFPRIGGSIYCIESDSNGGYFVAMTLPNDTRISIIHIDQNKNIDNSFHFSLAGNNQSIAKFIFFNQKLYLFGEFDTINNQPIKGVARIDMTTKTLDAWNANLDGYVNDAIFLKGIAYVVGAFTKFGGAVKNRITGLNLSSGLVTSFPTTNIGGGNQILLYKDSLILGGSIVVNPTNSQYRNINLPTNLNLTYPFTKFLIKGDTLIFAATIILNASYSKLYFYSLTKNQIIGSLKDSIYGNITDMVINSNELYLSGTFNKIGNINMLGFADINLINLSHGNFAPNLKGGCVNVINGMAFFGSSYIGGFVRNGFVSINSKKYNINPLTLNANSYIWSLHVNKDLLYIGGSFDSINGLRRKSLAEFNLITDSFNNYSFNFGDRVRSVFAYGDSVFVSGDFTSINGANRSGIACLYQNQLMAWNPNINNTVQKVKCNDNYLMVSGAFTLINGTSRRNIAQFDVRTGNLTTWNLTISNAGVINDFDFQNNKVVISGTFKIINSQDRYCLARLDITTGILDSFVTNVFQNSPYGTYSLFATSNTIYTTFVSSNYHIKIAIVKDNYFDTVSINPINSGNAPIYVDSEMLYIGDYEGFLVYKTKFNTGIRELTYKENSSLFIYPNPTNNLLNISNIILDGSRILIYDMSGKIVIDKMQSGKPEIDVSTLKEGLYNLQIVSDRGIISKKFIKM